MRQVGQRGRQADPGLHRVLIGQWLAIWLVPAAGRCSPRNAGQYATYTPQRVARSPG